MNKIKKRGSLAISQILILIIGIVAISYAVGSGFGEVSAGDDPPAGSDEGDDSIWKPRLKDNIPYYSSYPAYKIIDKALAKGTEEGVKKASPGFLSKFFGGGVGKVLGTGLKALGWAAAAGFAAYQIGKWVGLDESEAKAGGYGAFAGVMGGHIAGWLGAGTFLSLGIGGLVGLGVFLATYKKEKEHPIQFTCYPWQPVSGGASCEECNKGPLPCSEYQCRSLGQSCEIVNPGTNEQQCVFSNRNDVNYPTIQPWADALTSNAYSYRVDTGTSPPDRAVFISSGNVESQTHSEDSTVKCIPAYTPFSFGITTNEPASCKIDYTRKNNFEDMEFFFGGSTLKKYNHTQTMILPSGAQEGNGSLLFENDGEYDLSVRCEDHRENSNPANFIFKFCVDKGPDNQAPGIVGANLFDNTPISYGQTEVEDFLIYVYDENKVTCRWDHVNRAYEDMLYDMKCGTDVNSQLFYECGTTLTGLKDRFVNEFYFRCKDTSEQANPNTNSFSLNLIGTQPLVLDWIKPNGTVKDSTNVVKVTLEAHTSAGYSEGEATCEYEDENGDGDTFSNTHSYQHSTDVYLEEGDYTYTIRCVDLGGNEDTKTTSFRVESDSFAPIVVRAYQKEDSLRIVTNEDASCVYDTVDCSYLFDDGLVMSKENEREHYTAWDTETTFYIKCKDEYNNQPLPNVCNIIVRGVE